MILSAVNCRHVIVSWASADHNFLLLFIVCFTDSIVTVALNNQIIYRQHL